MDLYLSNFPLKQVTIKNASVFCNTKALIQFGLIMKYIHKLTLRQLELPFFLNNTLAINFLIYRSYSLREF